MSAMAHIIEARDLVKNYGRNTALRGISFDVEESEVFGYIGPNGAGKTTTIRLFLGLLRPTSGGVSVFGHDPRHDSVSILNEVGYIPGEFGLWPQMTGAECLDYLGSLHTKPPKRRSELCDRFEFPRRDLERNTRFYSRGMRQKIAVVQAWQHDPNLVVMDEPTEGLDPVMKERFTELVREHRSAGRTSFYSSHILSEVEECADRVAVLRGGEIIRVGDTKALLDERVRHCMVVLKKALPEPGAFNLPGVSELRGDGLTFRFDYRGDMEPLLRALGQIPIKEFLAERETLAEAFLEVYGGEPAL